MVTQSGQYDDWCSQGWRSCHGPSPISCRWWHPGFSTDIGIRRVAASYPMPGSTELQFRPPRRRQPGNSLPGGNESDGLRAFDAPALKRRTAEGAEAPYSGAPAVPEYGAVLPTNFLGLHRPAGSTLSTSSTLSNPQVNLVNPVNLVQKTPPVQA